MSINWKELIFKHEEEIINALEQAYKGACGADSNGIGGIREVVELDRNGNVSVYTMTPGSTAYDVWEGNAIEVYSVNWFNPWDDADHAVIIQAYLEEDEREKFERYLEQEEIGEYFTLSDLEQFDKNIAERVRNKFIQDTINNFAKEWAMDAFDGICYNL